VGYMDADMTRGIDAPKADPALISKIALDALRAGDAEIVADETSRRVLAAPSTGVAGLCPAVA
jgi:hypothetical protein